MDEPDHDPNDPAQVLGREVRVSAAAFMAAQSRMKSIRTRLNKLERGHFDLGQRIPFGLRWADKEGTGLMHDAETVKVWNLMKHLRSGGWGYGRIASALNGKADVDPKMLDRFGVSLPVRNRFGKRIWREGAIASMFRDPSRHTGELTITFKMLDGSTKTFTVPFPPLMTRAEFDGFRQLAAKKLTWVPRNVGTGSLLSGLCRCSLCGSKLHVYAAHGYAYYACSKRIRREGGGKRCPLPIIRKAKLEARVLHDLADFLNDDEQFAAALAEANVAVTDRAAALAKLERETAQLDTTEADCRRKLDRLVTAIADGVLTSDDARRTREGIQDEMIGIDKKRQAITPRRAALERDTGHIEQVKAARKGLRSRLRQVANLSRQEKRDLLTTLLPPDGDGGIIVFPVEAVDVAEIGKWLIEIRGLLPLEQPVIKNAVLGGGLPQVSLYPKVAFAIGRPDAA